MILGSAPGKIILFGEHAVVYGQPAIAVPLPAVQVTVSGEPGAPGSGITIRAPDVGQTVRVEPHPPSPCDGENSLLYSALGYPVQVALESLGIPVPDVVLTVRSTIPIASGLGSGAALGAALIRAVCAAAGRPLDNDSLNPLVYEVEKRHHGTPSGIDNTVIVYEKPVYFVRGAPTEAFGASEKSETFETFPIARPMTLLVADSGTSSPTRLAVEDVRRLYEARPGPVGAIFARIGEIVRAARAAIEAGTTDQLGPLMDENHALLRDLTVSSATLDQLCQAARDAGAAGAKLSGGGRGGNVIALTAPDCAGAVADGLRTAGAVNVIETTIG
jgi:mevalonate kinase